MERSSLEWDAMRLLIPALSLVASVLHGAWVIEDIPTTIQYNGGVPYTIGREMATAKRGDQIAIVYRSKYLYIARRVGTGWSTIRFDDNGRYPSVALDSAGNPHITYFRSSNNKLYYAHPLSPGAGNCGPNVSWVCEEIPATIYGAPIGRSAITVHGTKVHILIESSSNIPAYPQMISRLSKTIGAPAWDNGDPQVTAAKDLVDMDIRVDASGTLQVLINSEYLDWYRLVSNGLSGIGPLVGNGAFDTTSSNAPRICYRDFPANRLIYARSNGTDYWSETVIDWDIGALGNCSIAVPDPYRGLQPANYGSPRIAYFDDTSDAIKYAMPPLLSAQPWSIETVAAATGARNVDLYLDYQARPTIIYFDASSLKLRLANKQ